MAGGESGSGGDIFAAYEERFAESRKLFERARGVLAGGTSHDSRLFAPFPVSIRESKGAHKWEATGRLLIDYWMGHGALLNGHGFGPVAEAVARQAARGTHFGASHELEVRWAELVCGMMPSAERIRFTSSGTEATLLAMRVARAYTGRRTIVRLNGHFHGWHDDAMSHFVAAEEAGLNPGSEENVGLVDAFDLEGVAEWLETGDVAGVILEPGGGGSGALPWGAEFLGTLRELTREHGSMLIFDEVISGFRYSPGGVQQLCSVLPDITVLAKILCGGLPGGAIAGSEEVMSVFGAGAQRGARRARVPHMGTFNGNPLAAAAGIVTLEHLREHEPHVAARDAAERLVGLINQAADANRVDVHLYTSSSIFHILVGARSAGASLGASEDILPLYATSQEGYAMLRRALLVEGVDSHPTHGWVSAAHDGEVIAATAAAFDRAFSRLRGEPGFAL